MARDKLITPWETCDMLGSDPLMDKHNGRVEIGNRI